jgi:hypothetical protein
MCFDAILIPGNGVGEDGEPPPWVRGRLDRVVRDYRGEYVLPLSAGTTHRPPPRDVLGFPILEAAVAGRYLLARGVPANRILTETASYDTIGNAFFSRVIHVDPRGFQRLLVIPSEFHKARVEAVFRWGYGLAPRNHSYELTFEAHPDADMDAPALAARRERERESLARLAGPAERITTMREFHRWLFTEHNAYNAARTAFGDSQVTGETLQSY